MAGYICIGGLAAFGLLSMLWCLFGWLLPSGKKGVLICIGDPVFLHRFLWLRSLGLLRCPILIADIDLTPEGQELARRMAARWPGVRLLPGEELAEYIHCL